MSYVKYMDFIISKEGTRRMSATRKNYQEIKDSPALSYISQNVKAIRIFMKESVK